MSGKKKQRAKVGYRGRAKKRDANEPDIIEALEAIPGVTVYPLDYPCDLLVGLRGITHLLEVKNPETERTSRKNNDGTTDAQRDFFSVWTGRPVAVVRNKEDAYKALGFDSGGLAGVRVPRIE